MSDTVQPGERIPLGALPCGGLAAVGWRRAGVPATPGLNRDLVLAAVSGLALVAVLALVSIVGAGPARLAGPGTAAVPIPASATLGDRATAAPTTAAPTLRELVGQRFVVALEGTSPSASLLTRIRRGEIGGVILFGANVTGPAQLRRLTATLQSTAREAGRPPLLIATDQEGGHVRRLPWVGPALATTELGGLTRASIRAEALASGKELRRAGVNVNLAPVGDVPRPGSFLALERRTFARKPEAVTSATVAFARGLGAAHVAAAVKHFPGLGRATRNTDRAAVEITATRAQLDRADLVPFQAAIAAGVPMVMISNATYPALDAKPATWSTRAQSLLRRDLGFTGATISDALDVAATTRGRTLPSVAVLAAQAGVDLLLLTGNEAASDAAYERVVAVAGQGRISANALRASYARVLELKRVYG